MSDGYIAKCGRIHYFCGVDSNSVRVDDDILYFHDCKLGSLGQNVFMDYPGCLNNTPLEQSHCVDGKDVSNYATSLCNVDLSGPKWPCLGKVEP